MISVSILSSCSNNWNEHYQDQLSNNSDKDVMQVINSDPDLSVFAGLIVKSGYDKLLKSSKSFTVWAPVNEAIDTTVISGDSASLKKYVGIHICYSQVNANSIASPVLVKTLAAKSVIFARKNNDFLYDSANVTMPYTCANNGILYKIDKIVPIRQNVFEYLRSSDDAEFALLGAYFKSLDKDTFDLAHSVKIGVNSKGMSVYDSVFNYSNTYLDKIVNISSEDKLYTYFALTNTALVEARDRLIKYYIADSTKTTRNDTVNTFSAILGDLALNGKYAYSDIPGDYVTSTRGANVVSEKNFIVDPMGVSNLSNGIIYKVNHFAPATSDMIGTQIIEGEKMTSGKAAQYYITTYTDPNASGLTNQYAVVSYPAAVKVTDTYVTANISSVNSATYKFYWVCPPVDGSFQKLEVQYPYSSDISKNWKALRSAPATEFKTNQGNWGKVYLGSFTFKQVARTRLRVTVTNKDITQNLYLDYISMEPVLN